MYISILDSGIAIIQDNNITVGNNSLSTFEDKESEYHIQ